MRYVCQLVLVLFTSASIGCAMCQDPFDDHFAAYGGLRDRLDRAHGRVGSLFDPAAALEAGLPPYAPATGDGGPGDLPQDGLDAESDDTAVDEAGQEGLSQELLEALEKAQEPLPPLLDDET